MSVDHTPFIFQVLAKASKVIPVMIMGRLVSNKKYEMYEYVVAILVTTL
jgi:adenosine 3'-phospho 5'-phosphosulfate transporter B2